MDEQQERYVTIILQQDEPHSLGAALAMQEYIASRLGVITMAISENQLSDIVNERLSKLQSDEETES